MLPIAPGNSDYLNDMFRKQVLYATTIASIWTEHLVGKLTLGKNREETIFGFKTGSKAVAIWTIRKNLGRRSPKCNKIERGSLGKVNSGYLINSWSEKVPELRLWEQLGVEIKARLNESCPELIGQ